MKKHMKNKLKEKRGITLIALVITIIVLIILAAVSLVALTGENGLINRAIQARQDTEVQGTIEQIKVDINEVLSENILENEVRNITQEQLEGILKEYGKINYEEDETTIKSITTTKGQYEILLSEIYNGTVKKEVKEELASSYYDNYIIICDARLNANMWTDSWTYPKEGNYVIIANVTYLNENAHTGYVGVYNTLNECAEAYKSGTLTKGENFVCDTYSDSVGYICKAARFYRIGTWYQGSNYYSNIKVGAFNISPLSL